MKYDKFIFQLALSVAIVIATGCATGTGHKPQSQAAQQEASTMVSTLEYLPVPKVDAAGVSLPYVARENPYLTQRGRINKESVVKFIEAKRALTAKQHARAEMLLQEIVVEDKNLSGPWVSLGDIAAEQGDHAKAITLYQEAITRNSRNLNALLRMALAQRMEGNFLSAQNTYAKALALWPDCPEAHLNLAVLYDIYLNHPLRAQKHMEAYQFLTNGENKEVEKWLAEIQRRTGIPASLVVDQPKAESKPLS